MIKCTDWEVEELQSSDTDVFKYIFRKDDAIAEAVLYKYGSFEERTVMCISTQTGCQMGCTFCGTGKFFGRNLTSKEIIQQVSYMMEKHGLKKLSIKKHQIMLMSMGEPLNNMSNVATALRAFNMALPEADLLVSTSAPSTAAGWAQFMHVAEEIPTIGLQFSVHASNDHERNKIMPMKAKLSLHQISVMGAVFYQKTKRRPFFNYCVGEHNNSGADAYALSELFNPDYWEATLSVICEADETMQGAISNQVNIVTEFSGKLLEYGFNTRVFNPAGQDDIGGGCGQLWAVQEYAKNKPKHFKQSAGNKIACMHVD